MNTKLEYSFIKKQFADADCILLSQHVDSKQKLRFICNCGGIGAVRVGHFREGVRCESCSRKHRSESKSGARSPFFGKHPSKETIEKRRIALKGHLVSEETRRKISEAHKGKCNSEETRRRMGIAQKTKLERPIFSRKDVVYKSGNPKREIRFRRNEKEKERNSKEIVYRGKNSSFAANAGKTFFGRIKKENARKKIKTSNSVQGYYYREINSRKTRRIRSPF